MSGLDDHSGSLPSISTTSLRQALPKLRGKGGGIRDCEQGVGNVESPLGDLFGTWSPAEAEEFNKALAIFESVDKSAWR